LCFTLPTYSPLVCMSKKPKKKVTHANQSLVCENLILSRNGAQMHLCATFVICHFHFEPASTLPLKLPINHWTTCQAKKTSDGQTTKSDELHATKSVLLNNMQDKMQTALTNKHWQVLPCHLFFLAALRNAASKISND